MQDLKRKDRLDAIHAAALSVLSEMFLATTHSRGDKKDEKRIEEKGCGTEETMRYEYW